MQEADILKALVGLVFMLVAGSWSHFLISRKNDRDKTGWDINALRSQIQHNSEDIVRLQAEVLKEHDVKRMIEDSIAPIKTGINDIKDLMTEQQTTLHKMQLDAARREGKEEALKNKTDLNKS